MKLLPVLTALLVAVFLYGLVIERDRLFAAVDAATAPRASNATSGTSEPAPSAENDEAARNAPPANTAVSVVVRRSKAQAVKNGVLVRGQTEAARQVDVRAETSGVVISEPLRRGAFVEAGEELCRLEPGTRGATLSQAMAALGEAKSRVPEARARLTEAQARLVEAEINFNAAQKLSRDGFASDTRVANARASERSARAGVASAQAGLEAAGSGIERAQANVAAAEKEMERLVISAPFAGLLESDTAELGALLQPGALCATVIQLDPIKLVGFVPETEVERVELGALAQARLASGATLTGRVSFLSRSADTETRTFRVEVSVPNEDLRVRDGQTTEIVIEAEGARAHLLPQSALTLDDTGTLGLRIVDEGNITRFIPVDLLRDTVNGVLLTGLPAQADVIVLGQEYVKAGVPVDPHFEDATQ